VTTTTNATAKTASTLGKDSVPLVSKEIQKALRGLAQDNQKQNCKACIGIEKFTRHGNGRVREPRDVKDSDVPTGLRGDLGRLAVPSLAGRVDCVPPGGLMFDLKTENSNAAWAAVIKMMHVHMGP